jgi:hypothetical protein
VGGWVDASHGASDGAFFFLASPSSSSTFPTTTKIVKPTSGSLVDGWALEEL